MGNDTGNTNASGLPGRPKILIATAALFGIAAIVTTPALLIALGPLRVSLVSDNELTRRTAELTILGFRVACLLGALVVMLVLARWRPFVESRAIRVLAEHPVPDLERGFLAVLVNRSFAIALAMFVLSVFYLGLAPGLIPMSMQRWIASESGIVERGTALLFLVSSVMAFVVANRVRKNLRDAREMRRLVWLTLLGLFFFLCFGEELSWGQRILEIETLDAMKGINVQDENNLHNMMGYLADHLFILGVFVYGCLLPVLGTQYDFMRRACHWVGFPIASMGLAIGFALASGVHEWTIYRFLPETQLRAAEVRELLAGIGFLLLMLESRTLTGIEADS
jgi:hypothetical protein